ncbi:VWA domain-containing protein [Brucella pituitosa]|uniref:VWA domain-containing protein n=1 Tax=Brucella pituitosa TaxID=571256 RepID=UPI002004193F|nr:VWA domain-containing protein [Brucella pituitosa]MCK4206867.1 VWA domain-containing protein [Brucella pituitosa]
MIESFHFLRPWWLLALLLPIAVVWFSSRATDIRARWENMIAPHLLDRLIILPATGSHIRPSWLLALALALATLAVSGPTWQREIPPFVEDAAPLVIAVDLSQTMNAIDVTPSRLERAKLKIKDIVALRQGGRTAIVVYSGSAHQVLPLTDDAALLDTYADALATRIMPVPGKNTAAGLKMAEATLASSGAEGTILFITDGVEQAAFDAFGKRGDFGIVVLGVGTSQGGPVKMSQGGGFLTDEKGDRTSAKFDMSAMKKLATDTGVAVATMTDDDSDVHWVLQHVATNFAAKKSTDGDRWKDSGWLLLFPVVLLFALTFRRGWIVRVGILLLSAKVLLAPSTATASNLTDMWITPDQQGRLAYDRGDFNAASMLFHDPMWQGTAFYREGKYAEAIDAFATVDTPESWYNQGNALLHLGRFEEAVTAYKKTLASRKDWTDARSNLATAERLLAQKKKDDDDQPQEPNERPDQIQFDDKGKKGKEGQIDVAQQTSEMWINNIQVSPTDLMARKFAIEAGGSTK